LKNSRALSALEHKDIEGDQRGHVQAGAGLREGAVRGRAVQAIGAKERAEEGVKRHLLGLGALAEQGPDEGGQRQLAGTSEGARMVGMARERCEVFGVQTLGQVDQQKLDK